MSQVRLVCVRLRTAECRGDGFFDARNRPTLVSVCFGFAGTRRRCGSCLSTGVGRRALAVCVRFTGEGVGWVLRFCRLHLLDGIHERVRTALADAFRVGQCTLVGRAHVTHGLEACFGERFGTRLADTGNRGYVAVVSHELCTSVGATISG